jgi:hypothetical protein
MDITAAPAGCRRRAIKFLYVGRVLSRKTERVQRDVDSHWLNIGADGVSIL